MEQKKETEPFATELLRQVKENSKRWFIAFLITLVFLFASNMAWLYAWNLPVEETVKKNISQESEGNGTNNLIGNDGDIIE